MNITVLSGNILDVDVRSALLSDGIVILETTRTDASAIQKRTKSFFDHEENSLLYFSEQTTQGGWTHLLIYSPKYNYKHETTIAFVNIAIEQWINEGSPDCCFVEIGV